MLDTVTVRNDGEVLRGRRSVTSARPLKGGVAVLRYAPPAWSAPRAPGDHAAGQGAHPSIPSGPTFRAVELRTADRGAHVVRTGLLHARLPFRRVRTSMRTLKKRSGIRAMARAVLPVRRKGHGGPTATPPAIGSSSPWATAGNSVERLAQMVELSSRHVRRILDERGVPRVRHGEVALGVGLRAVICHLEETKAQTWVRAWVDDPEMQRFLAAALVARWRGHEDTILKLGATDC